jgi:hypothetical protein
MKNEKIRFFGKLILHWFLMAHEEGSETKRIKYIQHGSWIMDHGLWIME